MVLLMKERQTDPTQISVQLNISVPWQLREDLIDIADKRGMSLAELVRGAISTGLMSELTEIGRKRTTAAGATK